MKKSREQFLRRDERAELEVARTESSFVFDAKGKRYIDFMMGWCVGNFGWGNSVLVKEAKTYRGPDYIYPGYSCGAWEKLARLLVSIAPSSLTKAFRATGGSEAIDLALQAAMIHTGRRGFISLEESYHGNSIGGLSVGDSGKREQIRNLLPHCYKVKPPLNEQALAKIEARLRKRDIAAFLMEPIASTSVCSFRTRASCQACNVFAKNTAPCLSRMRWRPALAGPENFSRANTSICSPTLCAWPKQSPAASAAWARL